MTVLTLTVSTVSSALQVMTAMVTTGNERHALPLAQAFITTMKAELEATRGGIEDGSEAAASEAALQTCSRLAEGLPAVHAACKANDDTATALTAYRLLYEYLPADSLDFAEVRAAASFVLSCMPNSRIYHYLSWDIISRDR